MAIYCLHQMFDDFDALTEAAREWDIDFRQLGTGPFEGEMLQCIQSNVHFAYAKLNNCIEQLGNPPKGVRTFAIPTVPYLRLRWLGTTVLENSVLVFQSSRGLDCVSWDDFDMYVFSIPEHKIAEVCDELGYPFLPETISQSDIIRCEPKALAGLRRFFSLILNMLKQSLSKPPQWLQEEIQHTLPIMLMQTLFSYQETSLIKPVRMRDKVVRQIKDYLDTSPETIPKIHELTHMFHVSERTLEYAFREQLGVSPKAYLKNLRLNQVRKTLRQKPRRSQKIVDIANHFGFWHMGQFAADYRKLFGELPSETFAGNI